MAPLHAVLGLMNKLGKAKPSKSLGFSGTHELGRGGGGGLEPLSDPPIR